MVRYRLYQIARLLLGCFALARFGFSTDSLPPIIANQNHTAAGTLRAGVLTVQLEIGKGEWHPEDDDGIALSVYAFGETGRPLQQTSAMDGPRIRICNLHNRDGLPASPLQSSE